MAHLPVTPVVVPEASLLDMMKLALMEATKVQPVVAVDGAAAEQRSLNTREVMELLQKVCDELTRRDICTQVCSPKFCEEYGGAEWVQVLGLQDNRWVEVAFICYLRPS